MNIVYALMLLPYDLFERGVPYALLDGALFMVGFQTILLCLKARRSQSNQKPKNAVVVYVVFVLQQAAPLTFALTYLFPNVSQAMELGCTYFAHFVTLISFAAIHFSPHRKRQESLG